MNSPIWLLTVVALSAWVNPATPSAQPPKAELPGMKYSEQGLRATDLRYFSAPYPEPAGTPTTTLTIADRDLQGFVRVRKARSARDVEPVPMAVNVGAYLEVRKERKHYSWGDAQTCLAQFTNEAYGHAPNCDDLLYQGSGMTADGRYSVFYSFGVGHPRLPSSAQAQVYKGQELDRLESDPLVRLIEQAPEAEFQPGIDHIDQILSRLVIQP